MDKLRQMVKDALSEMNATAQGGATFSAGAGEQYATPFAFGKKSKPTKYYYKIGYKPVPDKVPGSGLEVKELFEDQPLHELNDFQKERIAAFDDIETRLNRIYPLISNAKNETAEYYDANPGSYDIYKSTEMILSYLKAIETLLTATK